MQGTIVLRFEGVGLGFLFAARGSVERRVHGHRTRQSREPREQYLGHGGLPSVQIAGSVCVGAHGGLIAQQTAGLASVGACEGWQTASRRLLRVSVVLGIQGVLLGQVAWAVSLRPKSYPERPP